MAARRSQVKFGNGEKSKPKATRNSYPFESLKVPSDWFLWSDVKNERSLRVQASKNGKLRNVVYSVQRTVKGLLVTLEHFREPKAEARLTKRSKA